jgi:hypothetical protein
MNTAMETPWPLWAIAVVLACPRLYMGRGHCPTCYRIRDSQ